MKKHLLFVAAALAFLANENAATLFNGFGSQPMYGNGLPVDQSYPSGYIFQVGPHDLQVYRVWDMDTWRTRADNPDIVKITNLDSNVITSVNFTNYSSNPSEHGIYLGGSYLAAPIILQAGNSYIISAQQNWGAVRNKISRPYDDYTFQLLDWSSSPQFQSPDANFISGYLASQPYPQSYNTAYTGIYFEYNVVPEPSTYALLGLGAIGMLMVLRRKKTA